MTKYHSLIRTEIHCPLLHATWVLMLFVCRFVDQEKPDMHAMLGGGDEYNINENQETYEA